AGFFAQHLEGALVAQHSDDFALSRSTNDRDGRFGLAQEIAGMIHLVIHSMRSRAFLGCEHLGAQSGHFRAGAVGKRRVRGSQLTSLRTRSAAMTNSSMV